MRLLKIATGKSRLEKKWKNKEISWEELCKQLSQTTRTRETALEYHQMTKSKQDNIKDVGGFVGGHLKEGHRRNGSVLCRSMLTLDIDFGTIDFWDNFTMLFDWTACVYSTHKHSNSTPRYRLLLPLTRDVNAEEYEAIARRVAFQIGIELFDDTTYQPTRLMYWPSTSQDAPFVYEVQNGIVLDPDEVLATYDDWHDVTTWPQSSRTVEVRKKTVAKQENPLEKDGLIGAWCRTYSITECMELFLKDYYEPCTIADRYTYVGGSTAAGVVVYEDKFAYSNHATDPISGKLCNAFDLVRICLFGEKDATAKEDTPANKLPSYVAMCEMASQDAKVKRLMVEESFAAIDFDSLEDVDPEDEDWYSRLGFDNKGRLLYTIDNLVEILRHDPRLKGIKGYNEFEGLAFVQGKLPWDTDNKKERIWSDADDAGLRHYIEKVYKLQCAKKLDDAISIVMQERKYHPVRQYLESLVWDGTPRLDMLFIKCLGASDSSYTRAVTRKSLCAAVARVYEPGCKFDYMVVFSGAQGIGKSTLLHRISKGWFNDGITGIGTKEAYDGLAGAWIVEMAELVAFKKSEVEQIKSFLSKREDVYRKAYARNTSKNYRQCVFFGTTNDREFLRDQTGNRRFWPVDTNKLETNCFSGDLTEDEIDQIWAEAKVRYEDGEPLYLDAKTEEEALRIREEHEEYNSKIGVMAEFLEMPIPSNWSSMDWFSKKAYMEDYQAQESAPMDAVARDKTCAIEIWVECFGKNKSELSKAATREINDCLDKIPGWEKSGVVRFKEYGTQRGYKRVLHST